MTASWEDKMYKVLKDREGFIDSVWQLKVSKDKSLRVTKVKGWAIYFEQIGGCKYLLHLSSELGEPAVWTLYARLANNDKGSYKLVKLCNRVKEHSLEWYFPDWHTGKCYSQINIDEFIKRLTYTGFLYDSYYRAFCMFKRLENIERFKKLDRLEKAYKVKVNVLMNEINDMSKL